MMANCFGIKCLCPHQLENPDNFVLTHAQEPISHADDMAESEGVREEASENDIRDLEKNS